ncbi:hypothetical protein Pelo_10591 [Pelomyxa schiedti]|nr:hypothetical protein Pelo_10591 [Pelomyxa schiedti]
MSSPRRPRGSPRRLRLQVSKDDTTPAIAADGGGAATCNDDPAGGAADASAVDTRDPTSTSPVSSPSKRSRTLPSSVLGGAVGATSTTTTTSGGGRGHSGSARAPAAAATDSNGSGGGAGGITKGSGGGGIANASSSVSVGGSGNGSRGNETNRNGVGNSTATANANGNGNAPAGRPLARLAVAVAAAVALRVQVQIAEVAEAAVAVRALLAQPQPLLLLLEVVAAPALRVQFVMVAVVVAGKEVLLVLRAKVVATLTLGLVVRVTPLLARAAALTLTLALVHVHDLAPVVLLDHALSSHAPMSFGAMFPILLFRRRKVLILAPLVNLNLMNPSRGEYGLSLNIPETLRVGQIHCLWERLSDNTKWAEIRPFFSPHLLEMGNTSVKGQGGNETWVLNKQSQIPSDPTDVGSLYAWVQSTLSKKPYHGEAELIAVNFFVEITLASIGEKCIVEDWANFTTRLSFPPGVFYCREVITKNSEGSPTAITPPDALRLQWTPKRHVFQKNCNPVEGSPTVSKKRKVVYTTELSPRLPFRKPIDSTVLAYDSDDEKKPRTKIKTSDSLPISDSGILPCDSTPNIEPRTEKPTSNCTSSTTPLDTPPLIDRSESLCGRLLDSAQTRPKKTKTKQTLMGVEFQEHLHQHNILSNFFQARATTPHVSQKKKDPLLPNSSAVTTPTPSTDTLATTVISDSSALASTPSPSDEPAPKPVKKKHLLSTKEYVRKKCTKHDESESDVQDSDSDLDNFVVSDDFVEYTSSAEKGNKGKSREEEPPTQDPDLSQKGNQATPHTEDKERELPHSPCSQPSSLVSVRSDVSTLSVDALSDKIKESGPSFLFAKQYTLKEAFDVYLQYVASACIDRDFLRLMRCTSKSESYFSPAVKRIDSQLSARMELLRSSVWAEDFFLNLNQRPVLRSWYDTMHHKDCQACSRARHNALFQIELSGTPYVVDNLSSDDALKMIIETIDQSDTPSSSSSTQPPLSVTYCVGRFCNKRAMFYHSIRHFNYHLIQALNTRLLTAQSQESVPLAQLHDSKKKHLIEKLVHDEEWVKEKFKKFKGLLEDADNFGMEKGNNPHE